MTRLVAAASNLVRRSTAFVTRRVTNRLRRDRSRKRTTYRSAPYAQPNRIFRAQPDWSSIRPIPRWVFDAYLDHRFDVLGSGWTRVVRGMECRGWEGWHYPAIPIDIDRHGQWLRRVVNETNAEQSRRVWQLVDREYTPVDWQRDFKSGFRWSERTWSGDVCYGNAPGVDVKVPWELARAHHLPQIAMYCAASPETGSAAPREFRNQVLDFIATNPPSFGVNWACTMDVAIRAANIILANEIFVAAGVSFDQEFVQILSNSMLDHGKHIVDNLERYGDVRANHYLANLAGLIFVASFLPASAATAGWIDWAESELVREVDHQFNADGTNFEGSTAYHRLSSGMVMYSTAVLLRRAVFSASYFERLERMAEFAFHITKPDGTMHQVGDNDSGAFVKVDASFDPIPVRDLRAGYPNLATYAGQDDSETYWLERHLDAHSTAGALCGIISRPDLQLWLEGARHAASNHTAIIRAITGENPRPSARTQMRSATIGTISESQPGDRFSTTITITRDEVLNDNPLCFAYPDFGLYIWRTDSVYMAVVCRNRMWRGMTGHRHNDQLAIELSVGMDNVFRDPGSYVYTPSPQKRNDYRSVHTHTAPWPHDQEPASLSEGLFVAGGEPPGTVLYHGGDGFAGVIKTSSGEVGRRVVIRPHEVVITDWTPIGEVYVLRRPVPFSAGYGMIEARPL